MVTGGRKSEGNRGSVKSSVVGGKGLCRSDINGCCLARAARKGCTCRDSGCRSGTHRYTGRLTSSSSGSRGGEIQGIHHFLHPMEEVTDHIRCSVQIDKTGRYLAIHPVIPVSQRSLDRGRGNGRQ